MRTVGERMPFFRIYCLLHGFSVSTALIAYAVFAKNINWAAVLVLLSMNVFMTVTTSMGAGRFLVPSLEHNSPDVVDTIGINVPETMDASGDTLSDRRITMLRLDGGGRRRMQVFGDPNSY